MALAATYARRGLLTVLLSLMANACFASYAQFCRFEGEIVSEPTQNACCVEFEYLVHAAESYEDEIFGEGWGDCDAALGTVLEVKIVVDSSESPEFLEGQRRTIWRDAMDMQVDGEMCTVVGFSAVDPAQE